MVCSEKSAITYKLYGITQFFERTLERNRILQLLALVQGKSSEQRVTYSDLKLMKCTICGVKTMNSDLVIATLDPTDIPGAVLSEPFTNHTITALRWWLLCRGIKAPASWKKSQLITR